MATHAYPSTEPRERRPRRWGLIVAIVVIVLVVLIMLSRIHAHSKLKKDTEDGALITVNVLQLGTGKGSDELVLPGTVQAFTDAPIYARTSGYVKRWYVDIGAPVKAGQLLAEIETPEVDQQRIQAQADLATAQANYQLSASTAKRYDDLLKSDSVSKQDADDKRGDATAKQSQLKAAQANLERARQLEGFKNVVAPFDGTVTARNIDTGALISAGGSGQELFHVADTRTLRIYIEVPQTYAAAMKPGVEADLRFTEHPGQHYKAKLVRTANAIDPTQRTLRVELQADNADGALLAGGYSEVHLKLPMAVQSLRLPAAALIFRGDGPQVALLGAEDTVTLKPVKLGRDFGNDIEVTDGVTAQDRVIVNPPDSLAEGQKVRVAPPKDESKDGDKKGGDAKNGDKQDAGTKDGDKSAGGQKGDAHGGDKKSGGGDMGKGQDTDATPGKDQSPNSQSPQPMPDQKDGQKPDAAAEHKP